MITWFHSGCLLVAMSLRPILFFDAPRPSFTANALWYDQWPLRPTPFLYTKHLPCTTNAHPVHPMAFLMIFYAHTLPVCPIPFLSNRFGSGTDDNNNWVIVAPPENQTYDTG